MKKRKKRKKSERRTTNKLSTEHTYVLDSIFLLLSTGTTITGSSLAERRRPDDGRVRQHLPNHYRSIVLPQGDDELSVAGKTHLGHFLDVSAVFGGHRVLGEAGVVEDLDGAARVARHEKVFIVGAVHSRGLEGQALVHGVEVGPRACVGGVMGVGWKRRRSA